MPCPPICRFAAALLPLLGSTTIQAMDGDSDTMVEQLKHNLATQQQQLNEQRQQLDSLLQTKTATTDAPKWSMSYGRPSLTTADGRSSLSIRTLVQADLAHYAQDTAGPLATDYRRGSVGTSNNRENFSARDLSDGLYFRRARLGIEGAMYRDFSYNLTLELGGSGTEGAGRITNAWIAYSGFAPFTLQAGAFAPNAGLDDGTAPEDSLFIERAAPAELARTAGAADGRTAIAIRGNGTRWTGSLALTGRTVGDAEVNDTQRALVARVAILAASATDYTVHLGASGTTVLHPANTLDFTNNSDTSTYPIRLRTQPELRVDSTRLIDTGNIDALNARVLGLEFAGNWRNVLWQGEQFWFDINRRNKALSDPQFSGYYLQASWVITGESHRYNMVNGAYQNPRPFINASSQGVQGSRGWGAWEVALRYSHTDLNYHPGVDDAAAPADGIRGGMQNVLTAGINWYLNPNVKLVANYQHVNVSRLNPSTTAFGASPLSPPVGAEIGQHYNVYSLRMQFSL